MSALLFVSIAAVIAYLYFLSKERRRTGQPPLPLFGPFFDALLDAEEGRNLTSTVGCVTDKTLPARPVARVENDIGEFTAYPDEKKPLVEPGPQSVAFNIPPQEEPKPLAGAGVNSTYLMPKQLAESPVSPSPMSTTPEQKTEVVAVPAPTPLPPPDAINSENVTEPDSKESKDSQDQPQKKKKKNKKKKSKSKTSRSKDSKEKKRWSKHKHHDKKKKEAVVVDPNAPPIA